IEACSSPAASIRARMSSIRSSIVGSCSFGTRSDSPVPRLSNSTTRANWRSERMNRAIPGSSSQTSRCVIQPPRYTWSTGTESAFFGLAFVNIGLMPDGGSTAFVPPAVGKARAFQMALLGERVPAQQALEWGLVNWVHPDERLLDEAQALVERLAAGPTRSYA